MLALIFPFQTELESFVAGMASGRPRPLHQEDLGGYRTWTLPDRPLWRLIVSGQGKVEAALACQVAAQALRPSTFLLIGSACGIDPSLQAGDLVLADPCIEYDFRHGPAPDGVAEAPGPGHHPVFRPAEGLPDLEAAGMPRIRRGPLLSADCNVFDPVEKQRLRKDFGALAAAWEGAGFHRFLRRSGARGWEIRLITEAAHEGRISLDVLRARMAAGFPTLYPFIDTLGGHD